MRSRFIRSSHNSNICLHSKTVGSRIPGQHQDVEAYLSRRGSAQQTPLIHLGGAGFKRGQQQKPPKSKPSPVDKPRRLRVFHDTQTGAPLGIPRGARCVQRFDDSLNSAIHITYRISLRSSSMREPRDPLLKVVLIACDRKM